MSSREHKRLPFKTGVDIAERAVIALSRVFGTIHVCGSIRRMSNTVGDIDLVAVPKMGDANIFKCLAEEFGEVTADPTNSSDRLRICHYVRHEDLTVPVDVWTVPNEYVGSAILHATGSGIFNAIVRRWARTKGMMLDVWGVWEGEKVIASKTEEDCFLALGLPFFKPKDRHPGSLSNIIEIMNTEESKEI